MDIGKLSYYSRKVHQFCLLFIIIFGLIMMLTGTAMKYPQLVPFLDPTQARMTHNTVSTYFSIVFAIMMATGIIMYLTPWILKTFRKPSKPTNLPH